MNLTGVFSQMGEGVSGGFGEAISGITEGIEALGSGAVLGGSQ